MKHIICWFPSGQKFTNGVKAMRILLSGAKKVPPTDILRREYVKSGGVERATRDFYSVKPKNIRAADDQKIVSTKDKVNSPSQHIPKQNRKQQVRTFQCILIVFETDMSVSFNGFECFTRTSFKLTSIVQFTRPTVRLRRLLSRK